MFGLLERLKGLRGQNYNDYLNKIVVSDLDLKTSQIIGSQIIFSSSSETLEWLTCRALSSNIT